MLDETGSRDEQTRPTSHHEEFLELCALATSGSLSEAERKRLLQHLAACSECRDAVKEFGAVVDELVPELTPEFKGNTALDPSFTQEKAEASFRKRLASEKEREQIGVQAGSLPAPLVTPPSRSFRQHFERYEIWFPLLASAVLCVTLGILGYRTGRNHGIEWARLEQRSNPIVEGVLAQAPAQPNSGLQDAQPAARDTALAVLR